MVDLNFSESKGCSMGTKCWQE